MLRTIVRRASSLVAGLTLLWLIAEEMASTGGTWP